MMSELRLRGEAGGSQQGAGRAQAWEGGCPGVGHSLCKEPRGGGLSQGWLKRTAAREPCLNVGMDLCELYWEEAIWGWRWHLSWAPGHPQK